MRIIGLFVLAAMVCAEGWRAGVVRQAEALPVREHVEVVRTLRERLAERLLASPRENVHRVLNRGAVEGLIPVRSPAFFSFTCVENRYGGHHDFGLERWELRPAWAGGSPCEIASLGVVDFAAVREEDVPARLRLPRAEFAKAANPHARSPVHVNRVYAVRSLSVKHDVLAVLKILARDEYGITFEWRLLH